MRSAREVARRVLEQVEHKGAFSNRALSQALEENADLSGEDRRLITELVYGVLRRRGRLDRALRALSNRGLAHMDPAVLGLLRVAAYQILFLQRIPAYAAVNEAVEACKRLRGVGAGGFANAILRRLVKEGEPPLPSPQEDPLGYLVEAAGLPPWLAPLLLDRLGHEAVAFADCLNEPAPLTLRVNRARADRDSLLQEIERERPGARVSRSVFAPDALVTSGVEAPFTTDAWKRGLFTVQDVGAQIVALLCGPRPNEQVLDACAGLGGKSAHLADLGQGRAQVDAVDIAAAKLAEAERAFRRLGVQGIRTAAVDLLDEQMPLPRSEYHRVVLDAPCSGLGVLRRHPEIGHRVLPAELPGLAQRQRRLLNRVATAVRPGGVLVYAVCTFSPQEGEQVLEAFLREQPAFRLENPASCPESDPSVPWAELTDEKGYVRTWPHRHEADAFFAARLRRVESGYG